MDVIDIFGKEAGGLTRFICPRCGKIKDPLNFEDSMNSLKRGEKGQTIRSSSNNRSSSSSGEVFSTTTTIRGTELNRSLQTINDPDLNEEANLRNQNMRMLRTETNYPESGRKVVKTYDK
jgi:hypothetical protein